ncbi:hypothetical protein U1872_12845 [Sphingomonas sp. RB3P16]|uniref:hypothetical protein n=1 Tax=Parasphingomonas frigoris TaxID=3096163 RepID=UPI002FCAC51E
MATEHYPSFDHKIIEQSLAAAHENGEMLRHSFSAGEPTLTDGALTIAAQCISVTVTNGKVCLNLPLGIGSKCFAVPAWVPNGTAVQACLHICTKWGIPCGIELTLSVAGKMILKKGFGCSC